MKATNRKPVKFDKPPVIEVVCCMTFALSSPLKAAHIGTFWDSIRSEFPNTEDAAPLAAIQEVQSDASVDVQLQFLQLPPLRRTWFLSEDGRHLVQLQDDRFIYNWKRIDANDPYPSYDEVVAGFKAQWDRFSDFVRAQQLGDLTVNQLELTYVNHIPVASLGDVQTYNVFTDHQLAGSPDRFLPAPKAFKWATSYDLPNGEGRLHTLSQLAKITATAESVVRMDLTARGMPSNASQDGCIAWFDMAHEWITHGFADLTLPALQNNVWRRTQ